MSGCGSEKDFFNEFNNKSLIMEKSLKRDKDREKNLLKAFAGESQARNRYEFFQVLQKRRL